MKSINEAATVSKRNIEIKPANIGYINSNIGIINIIITILENSLTVLETNHHYINDIRCINDSLANLNSQIDVIIVCEDTNDINSINDLILVIQSQIDCISDYANDISNFNSRATEIQRKINSLAIPPDYTNDISSIITS
jgi:hypothetical protein